MIPKHKSTPACTQSGLSIQGLCRRDQKWGKEIEMTRLTILSQGNTTQQHKTSLTTILADKSIQRGMRWKGKDE